MADDIRAALTGLGVLTGDVDNAIDDIIAAGYAEEDIVDSLDDEEIVDVLANYISEDSDIEGADVESSDLLSSIKDALDDGIVTADELRGLLETAKEEPEPVTEVKVKAPETDVEGKKSKDGGNSLARLISSFKV